MTGISRFLKMIKAGIPKKGKKRILDDVVNPDSQKKQSSV